MKKSFDFWLGFLAGVFLLAWARVIGIVLEKYK